MLLSSIYYLIICFAEKKDCFLHSGYFTRVTICFRLTSALFRNENTRDRAVFKWLSKVITWLRLLRLVIGLKDSRQFFNQWESKPKPIAPRTRDFSRASSELQVIARNSDWFIALSDPVVIGRSNWLVLVFRQSFENRSNLRRNWWLLPVTQCNYSAFKAILCFSVTRKLNEVIYHSRIKIPSAFLLVPSWYCLWAFIPTWLKVA